MLSLERRRNCHHVNEYGTISMLFSATTHPSCGPEEKRIWDWLFPPIYFCGYSLYPPLVQDPPPPRIKLCGCFKLKNAKEEQAGNVLELIKGNGSCTSENVCLSCILDLCFQERCRLPDSGSVSASALGQGSSSWSRDTKISICCLSSNYSKRLLNWWFGSGCNIKLFILLCSI